MEETAKTLITLGILLLAGFLADAVGRRTMLPRVTLLVVFGFIIGPAGFGFLYPQDGKWYAIVTDMALVMIGFLLGEKLTLATFRLFGRLVLWFSIAEVLVTAMAVFAGLALVGTPVEAALLLAGIATSTDPAATTDVILETSSDGPFTATLTGIVAVDDAWGLIVFSFLFTLAQLIGGQDHLPGLLLSGVWEIGGAFIVGMALGIPMAFLTGRVRAGEPTLVEALGIVFLCGGIALWLHVSFLLAAMVLGCVVANLAKHHTRPFHAIENIEWPFMILFFVLAGASLHLGMLLKIGLIGSTFVIFRVAGRYLGAWLGGRMSGAEPSFQRWMGMALLPQAGVALGMALLAAQKRPELAEMILTVVVASTVLFEVVGPVLTRIALVRMGETGNRREGKGEE
jgi:Kef-type K+ transport system membrane component KefB